MKTACPNCGAAVVQRSHLALPGHYIDGPEPKPLFAESYACGAVYLWGEVEGSPVPRACTHPPRRAA